VAGIVAAGVIVALDSGGSDAPTKAETPSPVAVPPTSVPQSDDPAQQARELADFLRAQSRSGSQEPAAGP
jgi:hypothetical protein